MLLCVALALLQKQGHTDDVPDFCWVSYCTAVLVECSANESLCFWLQIAYVFVCWTFQAYWSNFLPFPGAFCSTVKGTTWWFSSTSYLDPWGLLLWISISEFHSIDVQLHKITAHTPRCFDCELINLLTQEHQFMMSTNWDLKPNYSPKIVNDLNPRFST